ncbi:MAG: DUF2752 domain-containing protein [Oscillospiraceae bacterium]|nr:DUF2752 domain-containing protein [Oscillospiraceae bacterium]
MTAKKRAKTAALFALCLLAVAGVYALIGCPFRFVLGIPCPGCGATRAWGALLRWQVPEAFRWHPLFWLTPPLILFITLKKGRAARNPRTNTLIIAGLAALYAGVYIYRMLLLFPHTEPMALNENAILIKILQRG